MDGNAQFTPSGDGEGSAGSLEIAMDAQFSVNDGRYWIEAISAAVANESGSWAMSRSPS